MAFSRVVLPRCIRRPLAILTLPILSSESIRLPKLSERCRERSYAFLLYMFARYFSHATATRYCRSPFLIAVFACYLRTLARHLHSLHSFALLHMLFTRFFRSVFSHVVYTRTFPSPCLQVTLARYICTLLSLVFLFAIFSPCSLASVVCYFRKLFSLVILVFYLRSLLSLAMFVRYFRTLFTLARLVRYLHKMCSLVTCSRCSRSRFPYAAFVRSFRDSLL